MEGQQNAILWEDSRILHCGRTAGSYTVRRNLGCVEGRRYMMGWAATHRILIASVPQHVLQLPWRCRCLYCTSHPSPYLFFHLHRPHRTCIAARIRTRRMLDAFLPTGASSAGVDPSSRSASRRTSASRNEMLPNKAAPPACCNPYDPAVCGRGPLWRDAFAGDSGDPKKNPTEEV